MSLSAHVHCQCLSVCVGWYQGKTARIFRQAADRPATSRRRAAAPMPGYLKFTVTRLNPSECISPISMFVVFFSACAIRGLRRAAAWIFCWAAT
jgi:hypothetical protein